MTVAIVGLGNVGLPLAVAFAEAGTDAIGVDVDHHQVARRAALTLDLRGTTQGLDAPNLLRL